MKDVRDYFIDNFYYPEYAKYPAWEAFQVAASKWEFKTNMKAPFKNKESLRQYIYYKKKKS